MPLPPAVIRKFMESNGLFDPSVRLDLVRNLFAGRIDDVVKQAWVLHQAALDRHLQNYLITGGMPTAVNDFQKGGIVSAPTCAAYPEFITGGVGRIHPRRGGDLPQLIPRYVDCLCTAVSWNSMTGGGTDIASHRTVEEFANTLSKMFVLLYVYRYDVT